MQNGTRAHRGLAEDLIAGLCADYGQAGSNPKRRVADDTPGTKIVIAEAGRAIGDTHRLHGRRWRSQSPVPGIHQEFFLVRYPGEFTASRTRPKPVTTGQPS